MRSSNIPKRCRRWGRIVRAGTYREGMAKDFAFLLRHIKLGELAPDIAYALSELPGAETVVGPALMPHLVALDLRDCVLATVDRNVAALSAWNDATLEAVVPYLAKLGQFDHLLRLRDRGRCVVACARRAVRRAAGAHGAISRARYQRLRDVGRRRKGLSRRGGAVCRDRGCRRRTQVAAASAGPHRPRRCAAFLCPGEAQACEARVTHAGGSRQTRRGDGRAGGARPSRRRSADRAVLRRHGRTRARRRHRRGEAPEGRAGGKPPGRCCARITPRSSSTGGSASIRKRL